MSDLPFVVAMTGASGAQYGVRLVEVLLDAGHEVHFTLSSSAVAVIKTEMGRAVSLKQFDPTSFLNAPTQRLRYYNQDNFLAGIASGSFKTAGMAVVPCSMSTLATIAAGITTNLVHRAADVHLKERRRLVLVPRETPLHAIALENMLAVTRAGAVVLPAMPGFYHDPKSIDDLVDFVVSRILDHLGLDNHLIRRWGKK